MSSVFTDFTNFPSLNIVILSVTLFISSNLWVIKSIAIPRLDSLLITFKNCSASDSVSTAVGSSKIRSRTIFKSN